MTSFPIHTVFAVLMILVIVKKPHRGVMWLSLLLIGSTLVRYPDLGWISVASLLMAGFGLGSWWEWEGRNDFRRIRAALQPEDQT